MGTVTGPFGRFQTNWKSKKIINACYMLEKNKQNQLPWYKDQMNPEGAKPGEKHEWWDKGSHQHRLSSNNNSDNIEAKIVQTTL